MADSKFDITSTAIEKSIDLVKGFLEKLLGSSVEEAGLMMSDNIKLRRFKNQLKIFAKAQKMVEESGLNVKQMSLKALVPLIEYASLEEEETLQDKWANLIVNYVDISQKYESTIFPFILSQLNSNEIKEMDRMYIDGQTTQNTLKEINVEPANLIRLGLIEKRVPIPPRSPNHFENSLIAMNRRLHGNIYDITSLGEEFVKCCSRR